MEIMEKDEGASDFTHEELMDLTISTLNTLLESDPVLNDLPKGVTVDEVAAQLALDFGQSMTVFVNKNNGVQMPIVVHLGANVLDLKKAIRRYVMLKLKRKGDHTKVSWRYVWKTYWLVHGSQKLSNNEVPLWDYGVVNKSKVYFRPKRRGKLVVE